MHLFQLLLCHHSVLSLVQQLRFEFLQLFVVLVLSLFCVVGDSADSLPARLKTITVENPEAPFTQDAEQLTTGICKFVDTLWSM